MEAIHATFGAVDCPLVGNRTTMYRDSIVDATRIAVHDLFRDKSPLIHLICDICRNRSPATVLDRIGNSGLCAKSLLDWIGECGSLGKYEVYSSDARRV